MAKVKEGNNWNKWEYERKRRKVKRVEKRMKECKRFVEKKQESEMKMKRD